MSSDPFELARAQAMILGYTARWSQERFQVLAVEAEFRAPLVNPETGAASRTWRRGGKLDVLLVDHAGRVVFMEHKTTSEELSPGSSYWRHLHMDGQVSTYFVGAKALGYEAEACIYDVLKKPGQKPYQISQRRAVPESPEEYRGRVATAIGMAPSTYFARCDVVRLEAELDEAAFDDWQTAQTLREAERLRRFPRNPDACFKWGRACPFFDVCTGVESLDSDRFRQSEHVNPELAPDSGLPVLSASRLRTARSCQRLHKFEYIDGIRPAVDAEALRFGSLVHAGLEAWWRAPEDQRLEAALAALTAPKEERHADQLTA